MPIKTGRAIGERQTEYGTTVAGTPLTGEVSICQIATHCGAEDCPKAGATALAPECSTLLEVASSQIC